MDGGEKEKAVSNSIKEMVKQNLRRKESTQVPKQRLKIAPKSVAVVVENSSSDPGSSDQVTVSPPEDHQSSRVDTSNGMELDPIVSIHFH